LKTERKENAGGLHDPAVYSPEEVPSEVEASAASVPRNLGKGIVAVPSNWHCRSGKPVLRHKEGKTSLAAGRKFRSEWGGTRARPCQGGCEGLHWAPAVGSHERHPSQPLKCLPRQDPRDEATWSPFGVEKRCQVEKFTFRCPEVVLQVPHRATWDHRERAKCLCSGGKRVPDVRSGTSAYWLENVPSLLACLLKHPLRYFPHILFARRYLQAGSYGSVWVYFAKICPLHASPHLPRRILCFPSGANANPVLGLALLNPWSRVRVLVSPAVPPIPYSVSKLSICEALSRLHTCWLRHTLF